MNRGKFRYHVRSLLGDPGPYGTWDDDELNEYTQLESDRHAQEALSVEAEGVITSIYGVIDYQLPYDFGELKDLRYLSDTQEDADSLDYVNRSAILDVYGETTSLGVPFCFYRWEDTVGLYPVPNKPPILKRSFPHQRPQFYQPIVETDTGSTVYYNDTLNLRIEDDPDDPFYRVFVSHVSVYLRRDARIIPGDLQMIFQEPLESAKDTPFYRYSVPVPAANIAPVGDWYHFDFSINPIRIPAGEGREYVLSIAATPPYLEADWEEYGDRVEIAINTVSDGEGRIQNPAYFQLHQLRDDIELDYYRNTTDELTSDDDEIQLPQRYHRTLIEMVVARALRKNSYDLVGANMYTKKTDKEISYARTQAQVKTLGPIQRVERYRRGRGRRYMTVSGGRLIGRAW